MMFTGKVEVYVEEKDDYVPEYFFICAENYQDALKKAIDFYVSDEETELLSIELSIFSPDNLIVFGEKDKELFQKSVRTAGLNVCW